MNVKTLVRVRSTYKSQRQALQPTHILSATKNIEKPTSTSRGFISPLPQQLTNPHHHHRPPARTTPEQFQLYTSGLTNPGTAPFSYPNLTTVSPPSSNRGHPNSSSPP